MINIEHLEKLVSVTLGTYCMFFVNYATPAEHKADLIKFLHIETGYIIINRSINKYHKYAAIYIIYALAFLL